MTSELVIVQYDITEIILLNPLESTVIQEVGAPGQPGAGLPSGGTTGQVPVKLSNTNFDIGWADQSGSGAHISTGGQGMTYTVASDSVTTVAPPSGATGFLIMNVFQSGGPAVRWRVGSDPTASDGQRLESGRDGTFYQNWAPTILMISESGSAVVDIQWVIS